MKNLIAIFFLTTLFSCNYSGRDKALLSKAESLVDDKPKEALALLDSIEDPLGLSKSQRADYILLHVKATDKSWKNVASEDKIDEAVEYYESVNDKAKAAQANLYAGRVSIENNFTDKAKRYLVKATEYAKEVKDYKLLGLIQCDVGYLYMCELDAKKAKEYFLSGQDYFKQGGDEDNYHYTNESLAYVYIFDEMPVDSAVYYYQKALDYACQKKDTIRMSTINNGIGLAYSHSGDTENAEKYTRISIALKPDKEALFYNYHLLSTIFVTENKLDSARLYASKLRPLMQDNKSFLKVHNYYFLLCSIEIKAENYDAAFEDYDSLYTELYTIYNEKVENPMAEIERKYNAEKMENAYNKVVIYRQYLIIGIIGLALLGFLSTWFFLRRIKQHKRQVIDTEERMDTMKEMLSYHAGKEDRVKGFLLEKLDVIRKCAQISATPSRDQKSFLIRYNEVFNSNLAEMLEWNHIYPILNEVFPGIMERVEARCTTLNDKEKQICCLSCAGFSSNEMAFLLSYTYQSMRVRKVDVRKKLGFDSSEEFLKYLRGK